MANQESELDVNVRGRDELSPVLTSLESRLIRFVGAVSSAITALRVVSFPVTAVRGFEREMANVQKTTNFTDAQIKRLGDNLVDLSRKIDLSAEDLAKIASAAGQQGLGREGVSGVEKFTESVARMAAVLDISAEDAGTNVGKITSIFRISLQDIERVASTFNQVSNNSTASGEQLLDVVKRIGDAAGSLNFDQSVGLAASAIDFGVSPEVAGTSLSKIFAEFYGRADKFSALLGISVNDWMQQLQKDGIGALKMYLDGLRKLTADEQQKVIKELSGGGRIGVLLTKYLQDANNAVLDRNLMNASQGYIEGTSAMKEQATVLKTLDAEITKASNSFTALGIKAGEAFSPTLAKYMRELNDQFNDPAVIHFADSVGRAFLDIITAIAETIRFVSELNINFENLMPILKVFMLFKGIQFVTDKSISMVNAATAGAGALSQAMRGVQTETTKAAGGTTSLLADTVNGFKAARAAQQEYRDAIVERADLEKQAHQANIALIEAEKRAYAAGNAVRDAAERRTSAQPAVRNAANAVADAQRAGQQALINAQDALTARLQRAETERNTRLLAIEEQFQTRRAEARAANSRRMLNQAKADRDAQLAQENAYYARSLTSIQAYHARQIALAQAASTAQVEAAQRAHTVALAQFDTMVAGQNNAGLQKVYDEAAGAAEVAQSLVDGLSQALAASDARMAGSATLATRLGLAFRALGTGLQVLVGLLGRFLFWFSIVYTVLDALGIVEKLGGAFQGLTDALGLTSEATRKEVAAQRELEAQLEKTNKKRQEAIDSLKEYVDASGKLTESETERLRANLQDPDAEVRRKALSDLVARQAGVVSQGEQVELDIVNLPKAREKLKQDMATLQSDLDKAYSDLEAQQKVRDQRTTSGGRFQAAGDLMNAEIAKSEAAIATLEAQLADAQSKLTAFNDSIEGELNRQKGVVVQNAGDMASLIAGVFTEDSANWLREFQEPYLQAADQIEEYQTKLEDIRGQLQDAKAEVASGDEPSEAQSKAINALQAQETEYDNLLRAANTTQHRIQSELQETINKMREANKEGSMDNVLGSFEALMQIIQGGADGVRNVLGALNLLQKSNTPLTGNLAKPSPRTAGNESFNVQTEAEARRLSRARIELAKAQLQAIANLEKESNRQREEELEHSYGRSMTSIKEYYATKLELARSNIDIELRLRRQELNAIQQEQSAAATELDLQAKAARDAANAATPDNKEAAEAAARTAEAKGNAEQVRMQAQIVQAQGQVDLLQKQRDNLDRQLAREQSDAMLRFTDSIAEQRDALVEFFGETAGVDSFSTALDAAQVRYRDFVNQLRANASEMPELLPLAAQVEMMGRFEALEKALSQVTREANLAGQELDFMARRVNAAVSAGQMTRLEGVAALDTLRKKEMELQKAIIARSMAEIRAAEASAAGLDKSSLRYKELMSNIEEARVRLEELQAQGNQVAKEINQGIRGAFEDLFNSIASADTENLLADFVRNVTASISAKASEGLSDVIMQGLGSEGDGGIGGFFAGLFGATNGKPDGSSAQQALYVRMADAGVPGMPQPDTEGAKGTGSWLSGLFGGGEKADTAKDAADAASKEQNKTVVDTMTGAFSEGGLMSQGFGSVVTGLSGVLDGVSSGFGSMLGTLMTVMNGIISAIFTAQAAEQTSSAMSSMGGAMMAHGGGIAGRFTMRKSGVNPAAFMNAIRYHTGGRVGLAPDEVPAILQKGEEVITRDDPRHRDNGAGLGGGMGTQEYNPVFEVQPVISDDVVLGPMQTAKGRRVLLVQMSKSPAEFRQALGLGNGK